MCDASASPLSKLAFAYDEALGANGHAHYYYVLRMPLSGRVRTLALAVAGSLRLACPHGTRP